MSPSVRAAYRKSWDNLIKLVFAAGWATAFPARSMAKTDKKAKACLRNEYMQQITSKTEGWVTFVSQV